jgi:hypothetical protein
MKRMSEKEPINGTRRRTVALGVLVLGVLAALLLGPLAGSVDALGVYRAVQCDPFYGGGDYSSGQYNQSGTDFSRFDLCDTPGQGLAIGLPQAGPPGATAGWRFDAPPGTYFDKVTIGGVWRHSHNGWLAWFVGQRLDGSYVELGVPDDGQWHLYPDDSHDATRDLVAVGEQLLCTVGSWCSGSLSAGVAMHTLRLDVADISPPEVVGSGSLLAGEVRRGTQDVTLTAVDQGGGMTAAYALVNGVPADSRSFSCASAAGFAYRLQPCPASGSPTFNLDTQMYPFHDGPNNLQLCAHDFATSSSPNIGCWPNNPQVVQVDNSCKHSQVGGGTQLSGRFADTNDGTIEVSSREGATAIGRLTDSQGNGIDGATLCVKERTLLEGMNAWDTGTVQTDPEGYYKYRVHPGPNREVTVAYRHNRDQVASAVEFRSRAKPSLQLSDGTVRNGSSIRLFGSLPGPENDERVVVFQAGAAGGSRWYTFRKAETDQNGRFEARYRFRNTTQTTTYRMRVVVAAQKDYPYLSGRSAKRRVTVKG